jgi:hypothetical protein
MPKLQVSVFIKENDEVAGWAVNRSGTLSARTDCPLDAGRLRNAQAVDSAANSLCLPVATREAA